MNLVKTLFSKSRKVLNVGGGVKGILPSRYFDYKQYVLDIDPRVKPDICCDALDMITHVSKGSYDAVYSSHNLEHYYSHQVPIVLSGIHYALKRGGFFHVIVPDILAAIAHMQYGNLDLEDKLYDAPCGPISTIDVIYGWRLEIERSGHHYYAHKTAFTPLSLTRKLEQRGFQIDPRETKLVDLQIEMVAYKP